MGIDFERSLGTDLTVLAALADEIADWADSVSLGQAEVFQVNVAIEELLTNVITHGLGEGRPGMILLRLHRAPDALEIELRDDAQPFDPFAVPPPSLTAGID